MRSGIQEGDFCGTQQNPETTASGSLTNAGGSAQGAYNSEIYDCVDGHWENREGSFQVSQVEGFGMQYAINYSYQEERFVSATQVRGKFFGVYATRSNVSGNATGSIDGYGANAGIYGASDLEQGLTVDYYAGGALGSHLFDLSFPAATAIDATGNYSYGAAMAGVALSGKTTTESSISVLPRIGVDMTYTRALGGSVKATQDALTDSGSFTLEDYSKARAYAEIRLEGTLGATDASDENGGWSYALTPRAVCDLTLPATTATCGYGAVISLEGYEPEFDTTLSINLSAEQVGSTERLQASASRRKAVFDGAGAVISTMSTNQSGDFDLSHKLELQF